MVSIDNVSTLIQEMAYYQASDMPLAEPMIILFNDSHSQHPA